MMDEVARLCLPIDVQPSQGSPSQSVGASAGTHSGQGAVDVRGRTLTPAQRHQVCDVMRRVGFAAWVRTEDQGDWPPHIHGVAVQLGGKDDPGSLAPAAHRQVIDYYEGRNGLANKRPDDGPRDCVGIVWETYCAPRARLWRHMMFTVKSDKSAAVFLAGVSGTAGITKPGDLKEIMKALGDPGTHTAVVSAETLANISRAK